jgi:hypothetical protein
MKHHVVFALRVASSKVRGQSLKLQEACQNSFKLRSRQLGCLPPREMRVSAQRWTTAAIAKLLLPSRRRPEDLHWMLDAHMDHRRFAFFLLAPLVITRWLDSGFRPTALQYATPASPNSPPSGVAVSQSITITSDCENGEKWTKLRRVRLR